MLASRIGRRWLGYCSLERGVVSVKGEDTGKFLHGLTTSNVNWLFTGPDPGQFSCFLNHAGRVLFDCFLWKAPLGSGSAPEREVLIDCQRPYVEDILLHLAMYRVRSRVEIRDKSDEYSVYTLSESDRDLHDRVAGHQKSPLAGMRDGRSRTWGLSRYLTGRELDAKGLFPGREAATRQDYRIERMKSGVPEGFAEIKSGIAVPFDYNLDLMGAIDYSKGCYTGQELVTRVQHQGLVRKRLYPVLLFDPEEFNGGRFEFDSEFSKEHCILPDSELMTARLLEPEDNGRRDVRYAAQYDKKLGRLVRSIGNLGMAIVREELLESASGGYAAIRTEEPGMALLKVSSKTH